MTGPASRPLEAPPEFERTPPNDNAAEQSVLGGMMLHKDAISDVTETLRSEDFYRPAHQLIFDVILDLYAQGEPVDPITVGAELTKRGDAGKVGGLPYLHTLISSVPSAANAGYYAGIVVDLAVQRHLVEAGTRIQQLGYSAEGSETSELVDMAQQVVFDLNRGAQASDYQRVTNLMNDAFDDLERIAALGGKVVGVPTGLVDLDHITTGLHPGQLIVIAGRPGMGKTCLGLDIARAAAAKHGLPSAFLSLEMGRNEIIQRLLAAEARVGLHKMRSGSLDDSDWSRLAVHGSQLGEAPLFIDDSPNLTLNDIRTKARRLRQTEDLRLLVVDYLQLMNSGGRKTESRQQEVSDISRGLKLLAKELEIPVVALSQLNRGSEQRADKKPQLSDLRESGALEQDADTVVLIHREDAYDKESARAGEADLIVAKNRSGPIGIVTCLFQGHYSRFVDMAPM